jgi:hypothetical protein
MIPFYESPLKEFLCVNNNDDLLATLYLSRDKEKRASSRIKTCPLCAYAQNFIFPVWEILEFHFKS